MTEANSVPAGGLTRWQQIDAARAEALAYYGQPLSTGRKPLPTTSSTVASTGENRSVQARVSDMRRAA